MLNLGNPTIAKRYNNWKLWAGGARTQHFPLILSPFPGQSWAAYIYATIFCVADPSSRIGAATALPSIMGKVFPFLRLMK